MFPLLSIETHDRVFRSVCALRKNNIFLPEKKYIFRRNRVDEKHWRKGERGWGAQLLLPVRIRNSNPIVKTLLHQHKKKKTKLPSDFLA